MLISSNNIVNFYQYCRNGDNLPGARGSPPQYHLDSSKRGDHRNHSWAQTGSSDLIFKFPVSDRSVPLKIQDIIPDLKQVGLYSSVVDHLQGNKLTLGVCLELQAQCGLKSWLCSPVHHLRLGHEQVNKVPIGSCLAQQSDRQQGAWKVWKGSGV